MRSKNFFLIGVVAVFFVFLIFPQKIIAQSCITTGQCTNGTYSNPVGQCEEFLRQEGTQYIYRHQACDINRTYDPNRGRYVCFNGTNTTGSEYSSSTRIFTNVQGCWETTTGYCGSVPAGCNQGYGATPTPGGQQGAQCQSNLCPEHVCCVFCDDPCFGVPDECKSFVGCPGGTTPTPTPTPYCALTCPGITPGAGGGIGGGGGGGIGGGGAGECYGYGQAWYGLCPDSYVGQNLSLTLPSYRV